MKNGRDYLSVAIFAFFGGICRYFLTNIYNQVGTIICNLLGCFLLAFLTFYSINKFVFPAWLNLSLGTGFVGAFTTFSSFELDGLKATLAGNFQFASVYFLISIVAGYLMAYLGMKSGEKVGGKK
ncbi:fluoride efflux transporter FluC [Lactobacillus psittaci]|uniref:Fluoride-specific ion channel FluC n=1 Tax=Lactobacillus psittaci DSM 15354 TaxID=1122152 RepID=A0A0R1S4D6_9LACO|nr:CrcB family protein [Lactobacillus psittaci]KRL63933.1 hypothetical protein FC23_GL000180 [Lactobacillus psittaci DSM 15354]